MFYGEPVQSDDRTIIPVAQIAYGFGGGYGHGKKKMDQQRESADISDDKVGEGAGGGGGIFAKPKGVYEITPISTRFIPASPIKILVTGLVIGFLTRGLFFSQKKQAATNQKE